MSSLSVLPNRAATSRPLASAAVFTGATLLLMASTALAVGWAPVPFAFVTFFLLAGPHSWMEGRYYFLARMPVRWGSLRRYFTVALAGGVLLSGFAVLLPWLARGLSAGTAGTLVTIWNAALVLWVLVLLEMRKRQSPRRDWPWSFPLAAVLLLWNWLTPFVFSVGLAFVHPLMALWILDRELVRRRPEWRRAYRGCLCCLPVMLGWLWWQLANAAPVGDDDRYVLGSVEWDGTEILPGVFSRFLVAALTFLVTLHYFVWVIAFPLAGRGGAPWQLRKIPLTWRSRRWAIAVACLLVGGAVGVVLLWACLLADFKLTSEIYLMASVMSVLAETPFLLRTL